MNTASTTTATRISAFLSVRAVTTPPYKLQFQPQLAAVTDKQVSKLPGQETFFTRTVLVVNKQTRRTPQPLKPFASTCSSSSPPAAAAQEVEKEEDEETIEDTAQSSTSFKGCRGCGKEEIERGCNGEGRIQGGIAAVPGFGWWPIKAYRPCPSYLATGGRYRRTGQSMDEIGFGGGASSSSAGNGGNTRIKKRKFKKLGTESGTPGS